MKVCIITCYTQPDYIRAKTLRTALRHIEDVELFIVKNSRLGILRYAEVIFKTIAVRVKHRPDVYILTFRGYEMLLPIRIVTIGKKLLFDEFINMIEWLVYEHKKIKKDGLLERVVKSLYRSVLVRADGIMTDTPSHADISSKMMNIPRARYHPLIVSTDEETFHPAQTHSLVKEATFEVFYYGSMLPLHGVGVVLGAMEKLQHRAVKLTLIGGGSETAEMVRVARAAGADVVYKSWVEFDQLPTYIARADVCLGGPFGGTFQSRFVITGKTYQFLRAGRPVIIGKNEESHMFTDKKNALVVPQNDPDALAEAIVWAAEHKDKLASIGQAGSKLYEQKLSSKALTQQLSDLLSAL